MILEEFNREIYEKNVREDGYLEGIEEGREEKAVEAARSFYANGASIELIAKSLHMTEEEIQEIVNTPVTVKA